MRGRTNKPGSASHKATKAPKVDHVFFEVVQQGRDERVDSLAIVPGFCATSDQAFERRVRACLLQIAALCELHSPDDAPFAISVCGARVVLELQDSTDKQLALAWYTVRQAIGAGEPMPLAPNMGRRVQVRLPGGVA